MARLWVDSFLPGQTRHPHPQTHTACGCPWEVASSPFLLPLHRPEMPLPRFSPVSSSRHLFHCALLWFPHATFFTVLSWNSAWIPSRSLMHLAWVPIAPCRYLWLISYRHYWIACQVPFSRMKVLHALSTERWGPQGIRGKWAELQSKNKRGALGFLSSVGWECVLQPGLQPREGEDVWGSKTGCEFEPPF